MTITQYHISVNSKRPSIRAKVDILRGLKENVIMGRLIPAGTGVPMYRDIELEDVESKEIESIKSA